MCQKNEMTNKLGKKTLKEVEKDWPDKTGS